MLRLLSEFKITALTALLLGVLAALFEGIGIGLFIPLLQSIDPQSPPMNDGLMTRVPFTDVVVGRGESRVEVLALAIFAAVLAKGLLAFGSTALTTRLTENVGHALRKRVFETLLAHDIGELSRIGAGRFSNALMRESWRSSEAVTLLMQIAVSAGILTVYVVLLLLISWQMTIVVILLLGLMMMALRLVTRQVGSLGKSITQANSDMAGRIHDGVQGVEIIRAYAMEKVERTRFAADSERLARVTSQVGLLSGAVHPVYEILAAGAVLSILYLSGPHSGNLAQLLVFVFVLYRLAPVAKRMEKDRVDLMSARAAVAAVQDLLEASPWSAISSGKHGFCRLQGAVSLQEVDFSYSLDSRPALSSISATIPARGLCAVVGRSGAGKSTLIKLLLRFFDPTDGRILVDDMPLTELKLEDWRSRVAVVPQKAFLFSTTIRENIAYGKPDASKDEIVAAAEAAGAQEFIDKLPEGYDTRLGQEGVELSGGEAQRICLARALIRKPDLLLLDEATNALDAITEERIQEALESIRHEAAVVVIAHRLATIEKADRIYVLDEGRLVEQGTLRELVEQGGLFAQLYRLQHF